VAAGIVLAYILLGGLRVPSTTKSCNLPDRAGFLPLVMLDCATWRVGRPQSQARSGERAAGTRPMRSFAAWGTWDQRVDPIGVEWFGLVMG